MEIILSWIHINFLLCHLNKARIPVGIKIFATPSFYDHEKSHREVAPQHFHFQSKSASHAEVAPLGFYFWIHFPFLCYRRGQRLHHVLFSPLKWQEHVRIAGIWPTQLWHLSPLLFKMNQGFISMGNYKFRSIKLEVRVSGYMDILISNMYSARPLSLNGKEGTTRDSFHWTRSFWLYRHPHFEYIPCKTFVSLNGKEGTTWDSFQQEITS